MTYAQFQSAVADQRAYFGAGLSVVETVIPSNVPSTFADYVGVPAARYDNATFTAAYNAGLMPYDAPMIASNTGAYVYVVAPETAWDGAPKNRLSFLEQQEVNFFNAFDATSDALGLPSGDTVLKVIKDVAVGVAVTLAVTYIAGQYARGRK